MSRSVAYAVQPWRLYWLFEFIFNKAFGIVINKYIFGYECEQIRQCIRNTLYRLVKVTQHSSISFLLYFHCGTVSASMNGVDLHNLPHFPSRNEWIKWMGFERIPPILRWGRQEVTAHCSHSYYISWFMLCQACHLSRCQGRTFFC